MSDKKKKKKTVLGHDPFSGMSTIDAGPGNKNTEINEPPEINLSILENDISSTSDSKIISISEIKEAQLNANPLPHIIPISEINEDPGPAIDNSAHNLLNYQNDETDDMRNEQNLIHPIQTPSDKSTKQEQFIIFTMEGSDFAAPLANVIEIRRSVEITSLPNLPSWILGIANLRGEILSILNLKLFLNIKQQKYKNPSRMLIARIKDKEIVLGFMVDRVKGIHYLSLDQMNTTDEVSVSFISGVLEYNGIFLKILDIEALLLSPEIQRFEQY